MKNRKLLHCAIVSVALLLSAGSSRLGAQNVPVPSRVVAAVDDTRTVKLEGNVHPLAKASFDQGALPDSQPMTRMLLLLQRSPEQQLALRQLMDAQQTKGSASYHAWLTPEQFGKQFGLSDSDVQAVTDWLTKHGFQVKKVGAGRTTIEFDGTAGQVRNAFHTEIHRFTVNGLERFANVSDPSIPEALSPVVKGVVALHNFPKQSYIRSAGLYRKIKATGEIQPLFSFGSPLNYAMGPADFAKIYNVPSTINGNPAGAGQTIAIVGDSNINVADIQNFRSLFGLPANFTQSNVIVNGPDPGVLTPPSQGVLTDESEADLDIEWAGAVAPNANILFVVSLDTLTNPTQISAGIDLSALYVIDNNLAPVMSESFGSCEPYNLSTGNGFYNALWEQAAAEGITVVIAAGDNGPAACDPNPNVDPNAASTGIFVNGIGSTPFNVVVGGTDFDLCTPRTGITCGSTTSSNYATYWSATNGNGEESALGYIPEIPWDDSQCALDFGVSACATVNQDGADISAGGGGPSNCLLATINSSGQITGCPASATYPNSGYVKPSWQNGLTPADSVRDLPDVSFFASDGFFSSIAYVVCESDENPDDAQCSLSSPYTDFMLVGGTSAATPAFAAVMALVNQQTGERQGNANYVLYALAAGETYSSCNSSSFTNPNNAPPAGCVFLDVTTGNNAVACDGGTFAIDTADCNAASGYGVTVYPQQILDNSSPAFQAVAGYDLASGLGSINVGNLLTKWTSGIRLATTTTVTSATGGSPSGTTFNATVNVTPTPTAAIEDVSLIALDSTQTTILGSFGPFPLSGGTASVSTTLLPAGTAYVEATYSGDATHAVSTSAPKALSGTVTGAGYTSKVNLIFWSQNPTTGVWSSSTGTQNFTYGSQGYFLTVLVTNGSAGGCSFSYPSTTPTVPCPTGKVSLYECSPVVSPCTSATWAPENDFPIGTQNFATNQANINNNGYLEDQPINLNAGSYGIVATYPGDPNYSSGTSNTLSITLKQASTSVVVVSNSGSVIGSSASFTAYVVTNSGANGPTGQIAFTNGSTSLGSVTCTPVSGINDTTPPITAIAAGTAYCSATITATITSAYPPPGNGPGRWLPLAPIVLALLSVLAFVLGWRWVPQPRRRAYAYAGMVAFVILAGVIAGCGGSSAPPSTGGPRTIGASYPGDVNYTSSSGSVTVTLQ